MRSNWIIALLLGLLWVLPGAAGALAGDDSNEMEPEDKKPLTSDNPEDRTTEDSPDAAPAKWVYIYEDGCPVGYSVPDDFEMYQVECADIRQGNADLLREVCDYCPDDAVIGLTAQDAKGANPTPTDKYAQRWNGPFVADFTLREPTDFAGGWQELYGDWYGPNSNDVEYDRSTTRGNIDLHAFSWRGWSHHLDTADDQLSSEFERARHERDSWDFNYRMGSMEGGSWRLRARHYDSSEKHPDEPKEKSDLTRIDLDGRSVECESLVTGGAFAGHYSGEEAGIDNDFTGVHVDASRWLNCDVELQADARSTRIDAGKQDASVTRSDWGGSLGWDVSDTARLTAFARSYRDDSDVSAGSSIRGYDDVGARLDWQDGRSSASAALHHRDVDTERLTLENKDILPYLNVDDGTPTRDQAVGLRLPGKAGGDKLELQARRRFNDNFYMGATWLREEFGTLPDASLIIVDQLTPSYYADQRIATSLHANYDLDCGGSFGLRADSESRDNTARESHFDRNRYTLSYAEPLSNCTRIALGVTRQDTQVDIPFDQDDFDGRSWNYSVDLSHSAHTGDYRLSWNREQSDHDGGDLESFGLEVNFRTTPVYLSAWLRQRDEALGGVGDFDDLGVALGYRIDL